MSVEQNKVEADLREQVAMLTGLLHKICSGLELDIIGCQANVLSVITRGGKEKLVGLLTKNEHEIVCKIREMRFLAYTVPNSEFCIVSASEEEAGKTASAMEFEVFLGGFWGHDTLHLVYRDGVQKRFISDSPKSHRQPQEDNNDDDNDE